MNIICHTYRKACRELHPADCQLFGQLLREMATNSGYRKLCWHLKTDFLTLWFISAGRFQIPPAVTDWAIQQLPFKLNEDERQILY